MSKINDEFARFYSLDRREVLLYYNFLQRCKEIDVKKLNKASVITSTNKSFYRQNIFNNYRQQQYPDKELIVILNNNQLKLREWKEAAGGLINTQIYQLDESVTLGECLNFAIAKAAGEYVAKFDDDDYYSPRYLLNAIKHFYFFPGVAVVGKKSQFVYFERSRELYLIDSGSGYQSIPVSGGTHVIKREVFDKIRFHSLNRGEDDCFNNESLKLGFKHFAADPFNYLRMRKMNKRFHTWKIDDKDYKTWGMSLTRGGDPRDFVTI